MTALLLVLSVGALAGCSTKRIYKKPWMVTEGDVARYLDEALRHQNADVRRDNIVQISRTRYANDDTVFEAGCVMARSDESPSVRVAAIRLLAESQRPDSAAALLQLLEDRSDTIRSDARVDGEIINGLYFLQRNGAIPETIRERVVRIAVSLLTDARSRDVRISAARLLGEHAVRDSLDALISALNDADFGVVYHADLSLMQLTGVRQDRDVQDWREWLSSVKNPFEMRGRLDAELTTPLKRRWWQRMGRSVWRAFSGNETDDDQH